MNQSVAVEESTAMKTVMENSKTSAVLCACNHEKGHHWHRASGVEECGIKGCVCNKFSPIPEERAGREATPLHELKIWPSFFCAVKEGRKTYEIRKNDRGFMVGDSIRLNEYDLSHGYTGQSIDVKVTYLTEGGQWGLPDDICVMGIRLAAQPSVQAPCCGCSCITCRDKTDVHCWACAHT